MPFNSILDAEHMYRTNELKRRTQPDDWEWTLLRWIEEVSFRIWLQIRGWGTTGIDQLANTFTVTFPAMKECSRRNLSDFVDTRHKFEFVRRGVALALWRQNLQIATTLTTGGKAAA